ncbi:MAG: FAD-dependent oxidoreductase [Chloroflexi bacterium]|nr:FAD-dependent oxidoreductase [Chloroflexota bacterium]
MTPENPIIVYGTTWCPDCRRSKQFLGEHRIQYAWVDIEQDEAAMAEVIRRNEGKRIVPTIIFPDGGILVEPSNDELAAKLGLISTAQHKFYDVIIVGAGPAGLTTAIYTAREGLSTLILEKGVAGGQVGATQLLENYPGFDQGISGMEFAQRLTNQAQRFGVEILQATAVTSIQRDGRYLCIKTANGSEYGAPAALIATGSRYRRLNVPGERELIGSCIHFCATCDGPFYKGKDVLVVGGGNSGFQEGLFIKRYARTVTIVEFLPEVKASKLLQQKVAEQASMTVVTNHAIQAFRGERGKLVGVDVLDRATGEAKVWQPDGVFIFAGLNPNSDFLPAEIQRDRWGFVVTKETLETTLPGVFAAGDVRAGSTKQAASAAGEGATAALMIREYLHGQ